MDAVEYTGEERRMVPCMHEQDFLRLYDQVKAMESQVNRLSNFGAETKVYMEQMIKSQEEMKRTAEKNQEDLKESIRLLKVDIDNRQRPDATTTVTTTTPTENFREKAIMELISLVKWALVIIGGLTGAGALLSKIIGGTP